MSSVSTLEVSSPLPLIQGIGEGVEVHAMDKMHIKSALDELGKDISRFPPSK